MFYDKSLKIKSPLEIRFLEDCTTVGLIVVPQYPIGKIHADFAVPDKKIVIELDSKEWHATEESKIKDDERDQIYLSEGWKIVRITGKCVYKYGEKIAEEIRNFEDDASWNFRAYGDNFND